MNGTQSCAGFGLARTGRFGFGTQRGSVTAAGDAGADFFGGIRRLTPTSAAMALADTLGTSSTPMGRALTVSGNDRPAVLQEVLGSTVTKPRFVRSSTTPMPGTATPPQEAIPDVP